MVSQRIASLGPVPIDIVPINHFVKHRISRADLEMIWRICGPAAEYNVARNPLWVALCMAYIEGLQHGSELVKARGALD